MRYFFCAPAIILFVLSAVNTAAQKLPSDSAKWKEDHLPHDHPLVAYAPVQTPDRITIVPAGNTIDSLFFCWRSDTAANESVLEIGPARGLSFPKKSIKKIKGTSRVLSTAQYPSRYHKALVTGLQDGVTYQYRVGASPYWSKWMLYECRKKQDTVRLLYFGDAQNKIYESTSKIYTSAAKAWDKAQLTIHTGDLINHANNDYEWAEWHAASALLNQSIPILAAPGNHEYVKNKEGHKTDLTDFWEYTFPNKTEWVGGPWFFDYGPVRFILLNSSREIHKEKTWLEEVLSHTKQPWVVLAFHHPIFSGARNRQNKGIQENWLPLIEKYKDKIGLVLQGHDHTYARGGLAGRSGTVQHPSSPVFTVTVTGTKRYELEKQSWMDVSYPDVSSYQYIEITGNKITYQSFSETGVLIDQFELTK